MKEGLRKVRYQRGASDTRRLQPSRWWPALVVAVCVVLAGAAWLAGQAVVGAESLRVRHIALSGDQRVSLGQVQEIVAPLRGQQLLRLDLDLLRAELESLPGVAHVAIVRRPPDRLLLDLKERFAVARTRLGERELLVDAEGELFPTGQVQPGDVDLPLLVGLSTGEGAVTLAAQDQISLRALAAYTAATGRGVPPGATIDLSRQDRIVLRFGRDSPTLVLDRDHPEQNLESLFALEDRITRMASGRAIDLRFPHRLTLVPSSGARARR